MYFVLQLCVVALAMAKPQNARFGNKNSAGQDLIGVQNNHPGSNPTYESGSKHVAGNNYDKIDISGGQPNFGAISGGENTFGEGKKTGWFVW